MYEKGKITFLSKEQVTGDLKKFSSAPLTDLCIILGAEPETSWYFEAEQAYYPFNELKDRTGSYWTSEIVGDSLVHIVDGNGTLKYEQIHKDNIAGRPVLLSSGVSETTTAKPFGHYRDYYEVEYGEYPQQAASKELQETLENLYINNTLKETGSYYSPGHHHIFDEYEFNEEAFIRVPFEQQNGRGSCILSNGEEYKNGNFAWIQTLPIKWIVDMKSGLCLSQKCLFSGTTFDISLSGKTFDDTLIAGFLQNQFFREIAQKRITNIEEQQNVSKKM